MTTALFYVASETDYWSWGRGFDSRHFHNLKCGLGLEQGPPSLDWEVADLIKKVDINRIVGE